MRIKAYFKGNAPRTKQKSGQKGRNTPKERAKAHRLPPVDTMKGRQAEPATCTLIAPTFKNILVFCPLWSPKIPRKHQTRQEKIHFCPVSPRLSENLPRGKQERDSEQLDVMERPLLCGGHTKRDTPPHLGSGKSL